ncbi:MAG: response regulator transcription factor [Cyanobacteriota bacterium]|nr:response regulator transcription factor [Cyanobacteriota bacterium]
MDLAPRLEASGYRTEPLPQQGEPEEAEGGPDAVILAPTFAHRIPDLRRRWGERPILLGCPRDNVEGRCLALSSGADDLWVTSVGPSDLLTRLRLHLSLQHQQDLNRQQTPRPSPPSPGPGDPLIVVGDLQVDPGTQTALRGGRPLALTSRELQLLMLLLRHQPEVVSRERILREIWPEERTATSNVIEVYVRYLRRKLEAGGQSRLIHTVRGQGYCLRDTSVPET